MNRNLMIPRITAWCSLACATIVLAAQNRQTIQVLSPPEGAQVFETVEVRIKRQNPAQGYVIYRLDGKFVEATRNNTFKLDTTTLPDGPHKLRFEDHDASGALQSAVVLTLNVANEIPKDQVKTATEGVRFIHYADDVDEFSHVRRYLMTASARGDARIISGGEPGEEPPDYSKLDAFIALLLRQKIKEIRADGTAAIATVVQSGFQMRRQAAENTEEGGESGGEGERTTTRRAGRPPWVELPSIEVGKTLTKVITPWGEPVVVALKDRYPYRPQGIFTLANPLPIMAPKAVKPGDSWKVPDTNATLQQLYNIMLREGIDGLRYRQLGPFATVVGELETRYPFYAVAENKFVRFERHRWRYFEQGGILQRPGVRDAKCARIESNLKLLPGPATQQKFRKMIREGKPFTWEEVEDDINKSFARLLESVGGTSTEGEGGEEGEGAEEGGDTAGAGGEEGGEEEDPIKEAQTSIVRVTHFDYETRRVLRIEDLITTTYVTEASASTEGGEGEGGEMMGGYGEEGGGGGGEGEGESEPQLIRVTYKLRIATDLDAVSTFPSVPFDISFRSRLDPGGEWKTPRELRTAHDYDSVPDFADHDPPAYDARRPLR